MSTFARSALRRWLPVAIAVACGAAAVVVVLMSETGPSAHRPARPASDRPAPLRPIQGWPGPTNTGVPPHTSLHPCPVRLTRTRTYDRCLFDGSVTVEANNVTISRSLIKGVLLAGTGDQQHGLRVVATTIDATGHGSSCTAGRCVAPAAVSFANFSLERVNIYGAAYGVQTNGHTVVRDTYIHDLCCSNKAHKDGIISNGGSYVTVQHNNVTCDVGPVGGGNYCSAALGLFGDFQPLTHWRVTDNLLNTTGSYCLYGGSEPAKPYPRASDMIFRRNVFGRKFYATCGKWGAAVYVGTPTAGVVWAGNVWSEPGGEIVDVAAGASAGDGAGI